MFYICDFEPYTCTSDDSVPDFRTSKTCTIRIKCSAGASATGVVPSMFLYKISSIYSELG